MWQLARAIATKRMSVNPRNKIIISNGFSKFHLAFAAEYLAAKNRLSCLMTAGYPTKTVKQIIKSVGLDRQPALHRLIDREIRVPRRLIRSYWLSEIVQQAGTLARLRGLTRWEVFSCIGLRAYAWQAAADVKRFAPRSAVYHYRSGFGGPSVSIAKELGLLTICDHSIVHPKLASWLISGGDENKRPTDGAISEFWRLVLDDIEMAEHVLVNSEYVKHTFQLAGADTTNVHVIYLGIDDEFASFLTIDDVADIKANKTDAAPAILFAGAFSERKGAFEVIEALQSINGLNWRFSIAGTVEPQIASAYPDFFDPSRVRQLGWMSRRKLALVMAEADILLFPSRAEGSARVVFEALASGCFVITTKSAGSIVADQRHGLIVPVANGAATGRALAVALADIGNARRIGMENAVLVRANFTQMHYGRSLESLYDRLSADRL